MFKTALYTMEVRTIMIVAVVIFGTILTAQGQIAISFKYINEYSLIWNDGGSGAKRDLSIWRPVDIQSGFFPLGDAATASHSKSNVPSLSVSAKVDGALAPPVGFTEIWNDRGSGARADVRIMRMDPPSGYTCLGHVAVVGYSSLPDANQYRCVKSEYVVNSGTYDLIWKDAGSGAHRDVALWTNTNINSIDGIDANTFTSFATHDSPSGQPHLLKGTVAKLDSLVPRTNNDQVAIIVYEGTETEGIWNDRGSGARYDFSSWRSRESVNYFSLGDIGLATHSAPRFSLLVRARKDDALAAPIGYRQRWNDRGSGARDDVAFYEPVCPSGYRILGYVTIRSHSSHPSTNDIRCVKAEYTVQGAWQKVWDDSRSGARTDVTVWRAIPSGWGQGVQAMSARPCHCSMDRTPYVLNADVVQYLVARPVERYIITDIVYNIDEHQVLDNVPDVLARTNLINKGTTSQTVNRDIGYSYTESHTWSATAGLEIGISTTVTAGIPEIASSSVTTTVTASFSYTTGGTSEQTVEDSISAGIEVLPRSQKAAIVTARRYVVDVPYTATLTPIHLDDTKGTPYRYSGVYEGVQVNDFTVVYEADIPLD